MTLEERLEKVVNKYTFDVSDEFKVQSLKNDCTRVLQDAVNNKYIDSYRVNFNWNNYSLNVEVRKSSRIQSIDLRVSVV